MKRLRLLTLPLAVSLLAGCNALNNLTSSFATQNLTGNWSLVISDPPYPGPYPIGSFTGALSGQGANVTAVLHAIGPCASPTQDIAFTGTDTAAGLLTLTSTNLTNNVITITSNNGILSYNGITSFLGNLVVTGTGPCTMASITLRGFEYPPITGTYTGTLTSTANTTANFTAILTQSPANADGAFPESGTITVAGATCTNVFSVTGLVNGPTLAAALTATSGPPATAILITGPALSSTVPLFPFSLNIVSTGCNNGSFSGNLNKQ